MCLNCGGVAKGQKVELQMLCLHGPSGRCTNCMVTDGGEVEGLKHVSFQEFLRVRRVGCEASHAASTVCPNCMPPSEISYKLRPGCNKHKPWPLGLCNECQPPPATLMRQKYRHVDYVEFRSVDAVKAFAGVWYTNGMALQRAGLLYGSYAPDPAYPSGCKAVVQAIYEPPQSGATEGVTLREDPREAVVERIAGALGLQRIGWIFTHLPRDFVLASSELRRAAKFQNAHRVPGVPGSKFVTLVMRQDAATGEVEPRGFMASDQAMALERDGVLGRCVDPKWVEVRAADKAEVLPAVVKNDPKTGSAEVKRFEVEFLLVEVGCGQPRVAPGEAALEPLFAHCAFPVENRAEEFGVFQDSEALQRHLVQFAAEPMHSRLSDFHLLLHLAERLDIDSALACCHAVRTRSRLERGLEEILEAHSGAGAGGAAAGGGARRR
jgi:nuclear protein localization family protein 4